MNFPELKTGYASCNSWVCTHPISKCPVETFKRSKALEAHSKGWHVVTAYDHLVALNNKLNNK